MIITDEQLKQLNDLDDDKTLGKRLVIKLINYNHELEKQNANLEKEFDLLLNEMIDDILMKTYPSMRFNIKKVIFNNPITMVYWEDGTKTVVKCSPDDTYDKEKGLALCFMKQLLGNTGCFNNVLKKYCESDYK